MNKIDWASKLSSRKFWAAVAGFAVALCVIFKADRNTTQMITGLLAAIADVAVYMFAEAIADSNRNKPA